jgi:hypothetical protein
MAAPAELIQARACAYYWTEALFGQPSLGSFAGQLGPSGLAQYWPAKLEKHGLAGPPGSPAMRRARAVLTDDEIAAVQHLLECRASLTRLPLSPTTLLRWTGHALQVTWASEPPASAPSDLASPAPAVNRCASLDRLSGLPGRHELERRLFGRRRRFAWLRHGTSRPYLALTASRLASNSARSVTCRARTAKSRPSMCRMARPLAKRFRGQSRTRPRPERIWMRPCASVVIQIVWREGRPRLRPNVVRSTSGAVAAADASSSFIRLLTAARIACPAGIRLYQPGSGDRGQAA